jgi:ribosome-associated protein
VATLVPKRARKQDEAYIATAKHMAALAAEKKAEDIRAYNVSGLTLIADAFVVCTATSEPQMRAIYNHVREGMREAGGSPLHTEGDYHGGWLLLDYGAVIFHLFRREARAFYDLDGMWGDAPEIPLSLD